MSDQLLDEPISDTLGREFTRIGGKLKCVLLPSTSGRRREIIDWDLWGPLFICLVLASVLSMTTTGDKTESTTVFTTIFVVIWVGAAIISVNGQLLGGTLSLFQSVCVLGYSISPITAAALLVIPFKAVFGTTVQIIIVAAGVAWSVVSSIGFISHLVPPNKKFLAEYPLILFFIFLGWFILVLE